MNIYIPRGSIGFTIELRYGHQEKKGAPHLHVCLFPMHTPSNSGLSLANEGLARVLSALAPIAATAFGSC